MGQNERLYSLHEQCRSEYSIALAGRLQRLNKLVNQDWQYECQRGIEYCTREQDMMSLPGQNKVVSDGTELEVTWCVVIQTHQVIALGDVGVVWPAHVESTTNHRNNPTFSKHVFLQPIEGPWIMVNTRLFQN